MLKDNHAQPIWPCLIILGFGYCTGMQLGKVAPYVGRLSAEFGFSLPQAGWLTALLAIFVATATVPIGRLINRFGALACFKIGALIMLVGAVAFGAASTPELMLGARGIEAAGYVLVVIAGPAYLAYSAPETLKPVLLALWGSVASVGFALSNFTADSLPATLTLSSAFLLFAVPLAGFLPLVLAIGREPTTPSTRLGTIERTKSEAPIAWVLAIGFGLYVYLSLGFFTFLPTFLATHPDASVSPGTIALFAPLGSFSAAFILARMRNITALLVPVAGFMALALAALLIFVIPESSTSAMAGYAFCCGVGASSLFAAVPLLTQSKAASTRTIGAIAQAGGIATLIGPPVAGWIIEQWGWPALGWSFTAIALAQVVALVTTVKMRLKTTIHCRDTM